MKKNTLTAVHRQGRCQLPKIPTPALTLRWSSQTQRSGLLIDHDILRIWRTDEGEMKDTTLVLTDIEKLDLAKNLAHWHVRSNRLSPSNDQPYYDYAYENGTIVVMPANNVVDKDNKIINLAIKKGGLIRQQCWLSESELRKVIEALMAFGEG